MSVLYSESSCSLISHKEYIDRIYNATAVSQENGDSDLKKTFALREDLFDFSCNNSKNGDDDDDKKRHRKINTKKTNLSYSKYPEIHVLNQKIASKSKEFLGQCITKHFFDNATQTHRKDDDKPISLFKEVSNQKVLDTPLNGRNTLDHALITNISGQTFLIPPNCRFTNNCVSEIDKFADELYDFVVIDPPWWNKYIRRVRRSKRDEGYEMMRNEDILKIPLEDLTHPSTIVAIWCTNSPTHTDFIKNVALPKWNLKLLTTYHWMKITKSGDPVCEFHEPLRKQPYEKLFLAAHIESKHESQLDDINLIFSIPSVVHSHKPPLLDTFKDYLPAQPKCLEIFARYLLPHFSSIGREVLKLQNSILFEENPQPGTDRSTGTAIVE